jgi:recombination DNA repair RAD52 pathway protein
MADWETQPIDTSNFDGTHDNISTVSTSAFTAREPEQISEILSENFNPAFVATRPGPGGSKFNVYFGVIFANFFRV